MILSTYHTHTIFSDGKNTAEEMVLEAIRLGMTEIGFSDHAPMIFDCPWAMKETEVCDYKKTILELKEKYKDKINVLLGIEQDYYSKDAIGYDYIIGSVHYVLKNGEYLPVDEGADVMKSFVDKHYNGDVYGYCEDYFKLMADIYNKTKCDIIGHFDLVTKFNEKLPMIDVNNPRYVKAYSEAIESLLKTPAIFEINTGAISRGYRTSSYPDSNMIDIIGKANKPFVFTSDTHNKETILFNLNNEEGKIKKLGYSYLTTLEKIKAITKA